MESMQPKQTNGRVSRLIIGVSVFAGLAAGYFFFHKKMEVPSTAFSSLNTALRKLWSDHVFWTRDYIIAAVADSPDAKAASVRLLKNQEDLGAAMVAYYGNDAGAKLTQLLKDHILIAVDVVAAAKAGDKDKRAESDKKWHQNADDIAAFLSSANPNWPQQEMQNMLYDHLKLTTQEAVARLQKEWEQDVAVFDEIYTQALHMADEFSTGIAKQFPEKFNS